MANESLFPNGGSSSGAGTWTFTGGSNLWDGIDNATPVDGEFDSITGGSVEGTVLTLDLTSTTIADGDTVTRIDIKVRAKGVDADDGLDVELVIGGTGQGVVSQTITSTITDYTLNTAGWNSDRTQAQLNGAQVTIANTQAGMPTSSTWTVYEVEVDITFTTGSTTFFETVAATAVGTPTMVKEVTKTIPVTAIGNATLIKQVSKTIAATASGNPTVATAATFLLAIIATAIGVATINTSFVVSVAIAATALGLATISGSVIFGVSIVATAIGVVSLGKMILKSIAITAIGLPQTIKKMFKAIPAVALAIPTLTKQISKTIAVITIGIPIVLASLVIKQTVAAIAIGVPGVVGNIVILVGKVTNIISGLFSKLFSKLFSTPTEDD